MKKDLKFIREMVESVKNELKKLNPSNFIHTLNGQLHILSYIESKIKYMEKIIEEEKLYE